ncbi:MAG: proton-conducting transporter membrane subunit, partial [Flavobacteriales bacterium]
EAFRGLARKNPLLAALTVVSMLSLAGIPPTAGFFAKYFIFTSALASGHLILVLIAVAGSLVGVYYYFRPLMALFSSADDSKITINRSTTALLVLLAAASLFFGMAPAWLTSIFS